MAKTTNLIIGIGGHVVAIDPATGTEVWRSALRGNFVTVKQIGDRIYAGAGGELYCLDPASGDVLWCNKLKGLGRDVLAFSDDSDLVAAASAAARQRAAAAAAAAG